MGNARCWSNKGLLTDLGNPDALSSMAVVLIWLMSAYVKYEVIPVGRHTSRKSFITLVNASAYDRVQTVVRA
jgi:hypothetical protein